MSRMSHLISGTEEMLISSWRSQVTRGEEQVEMVQYYGLHRLFGGYMLERGGLE